MSDQFCSGTYLADRAADGKDYPDTGPSPFDRVATRDDGCDDNGEPLCALPEDHETHGDKWPIIVHRTDFFSVACGIVRSQHHLNTES